MVQMTARSRAAGLPTIWVEPFGGGSTSDSQPTEQPGDRGGLAATSAPGWAPRGVVVRPGGRVLSVGPELKELPVHFLRARGGSAAALGERSMTGRSPS